VSSWVSGLIVAVSTKFVQGSYRTQFPDVMNVFY
jgi:hypothetical protein